jgi:Zn-dependent protease
MFTRARTVGHVGGIAIRIDATWAVIAALIALSLWAQYADRSDVGAWPAVAMGIVGALLFFASVLLHELGHALEARRHGLEVRGITLFLFGGVTESSFRFRSPADELVMVAAGPLTSFVLAAAFGAVAWGADALGVTVVAVVAGTLAWVNLALGLFNLVPGAPLDGGRLLQAVVWRATGDRTRSMVLAATVGRVIGVGFAVAGAALFLFLPGGVIDGAWLALVGWFLYRTATAEAAWALVEGALAATTVGALVPDHARTLSPAATVRDAEIALLGARDDDVVAVVDHGHVEGVVATRKVEAIPPAARPEHGVVEVVEPVRPDLRLDAGREATVLLEMEPTVPVVVQAAGRDVGVVTPARAIALARRRRALSAG